jgi:hypothetical protein
MKYSIILFASAFLFTIGCKSGFYGTGDFQSVLKIDSHAHIDTDKGVFEKQAVADNFRLLTINVDISDSVAVIKQHEQALESVKNFPKNVNYIATFYFDTAGFGTDGWSRKIIAHLEKDIAGGAIAVKIWKNIGMKERDRTGRFIMVDDPALDPVINYIISRHLPVTGHLGEPRNCWLPLDKMTVSGDSSYFAENPQYHMFLHPDFPSYEAQIDARDHLLEKHPDLTFIGCHLGSLEWSVVELAKRLDKFPNMAVDMAARICHLQYQAMTDRKKVRDFCIKYQDRLLYGTDLSEEGAGTNEELAKNMHSTWTEDWKFFVTADKMTCRSFRGEFEGLQLPKEVVRKIYSENAIKWYNLNTGSKN